MLSLHSAAPKAFAASSAPGAGTWMTGPRLAGDRVVWGQRRRDRGLDLRTARLPSLRMRSILFSVRPRNRSADWFRGFLAASPALIAMRNAEKVSGLGSDYYTDFGTTGLYGTQTRKLVPPCPPSEDCRPFAIDADGSRLLTAGPRGNTVTLADLASNTSRELPAVGLDVRVAGRYVAWVTAEGQVVIYDYEAGRELYRVSGAARANQSLDLQADGKVVFSVGDGIRMRLAWASPQSQTAHLLPLAVSYRYTALLADDQVVFSRNAPGPNDSEIGVVGLAGLGTVLVRPAIATESGERSYDFDGEPGPGQTLGVGRAHL